MDLGSDRPRRFNRISRPRVRNRGVDQCPRDPDDNLTGDPLDRGLAAAFGPAPALHGALETLADSIGPVPRVLLPDTDTSSEGPLIKPASTEVPDAPGRYQLFGEIARGGMGAVLKGRDADLGRDLAVKVLLEEHCGKPELARRFVEEAQIGGQLQHPGIVPIYELGTFADLRPFFTMKLIKGRTLAAPPEPAEGLDRRPAAVPRGSSGAGGRTRWPTPTRGVIHRDLKPSNVMVGSFGEVQVMDWGLAKVLKEGGIADEERRHAPPAELQVSVIRTVRSGSGEDESQAGSVLGTPAYMAPEQAGGDVERVDRRADVFGLGSILCEVLTGQPAYVGRNNNEVYRLALRGDTADACTRLDACGADADLVAAGPGLPCLQTCRPAARTTRAVSDRTDHGLPGRRAREAALRRTRARRGAGAGRRGTAAAQAASPGSPQRCWR